MDATLHIYVFKEGWLARFAHDLRLVVPGFEMTLERGVLNASFDPRSARVEGSVVNERLDPDGISPSDKASIVETICHDILDCAHHPQVRFEGRLARGRVSGQLQMHGRSQPIEAAIDMRPGAALVDLTLTPSKWGIAPYKALGGTIRLQDRWRVRLFAPYDAEGALEDATLRWVGYDSAMLLKERASSPRIPKPAL
jgi:hypothetical protein